MVFLYLGLVLIVGLFMVGCIIAFLPSGTLGSLENFFKGLFGSQEQVSKEKVGKETDGSGEGPR